MWNTRVTFIHVTYSKFMPTKKKKIKIVRLYQNPKMLCVYVCVCETKIEHFPFTRRHISKIITSNRIELSFNSNETIKTM